MLRGLRRSHRLLAPFAIAIAAMVVLGSADWWHADDEDGQPAFHDHAAHNPVFQSPKHSATTAPEHCYLCHWLRTLGNSIGQVAFHPAAPSKGRQALTVARCFASDPATALFSARAPPV